MFGPPASAKVVVLDGVLNPGHGEDDTEIVGWWFTARDIYRDPNDGLHWGDLLSEALDRTIPNLDSYSRLDLRTYLATRHMRLREAYPALTDLEIDRLLAEQSPIDYGRALGTDFVVITRIQDAWLSHQRTFHWWSGVAIVEVEVWDVSSGRIVQGWSAADRDLFSSTFRVMRDLAYECARDLGRTAAFAVVPPVAPVSPLE
jgi:hypothetical protein